jgi:Carboxypeptidase regulatory-like domain
MLRIASTALIAWLLIPASALSAQNDRSRLMGIVTDVSGGALPGATVTISGAAIRPSSVVTDGSGRYITPWLAPGSYDITFALSGFETRTVTGISLGTGQTVVLDQQLPIGSLSEVVEVKAPAPPPPPPPPRPALVPPPPRAKPVDKEILASVCGPRQSPDFALAIGHVVSHRDDAGRELLGPNDLLRIDAGEKQGVADGQNLIVRRRFETGERFAPKKLQTFGEQTVGLVQIVETEADSSVAIVVYACGEISAGDAIERYVPQPAFFAVAPGTPRFDEPARITTGEYGQQAASAGQMMVIASGIMQGVQRGQQLTIFRRAESHTGLMNIIGDGVIVAVRADSATIRIERAVDAVVVGDLVAIHR